jgi:hypothetical protein
MKSLCYILDDNMLPVPVPDGNNDAWLWAHKYPDKRRVGDTRLSNGYRISTVFLVLDHSFNDHGTPVLWETIVFGPDSYEDLAMDRYTSYEDAVQGHKNMVEKTLIKLHQEDPNANVTIMGS